MISNRRHRRRAALPALLAPALFLALAPISSRAELNFYGRENIQLIEARYAPLMPPETGGNYDLIFTFVSSADQVDLPGKARLFNGASVGGGGFNWVDADIQGTDRNAAGAYILLLYNGYLFSDSKADQRAYFNWSLGLARGSFWGDPVGVVEPVISSMNIYCAGLRGGFEFRVYEKYFLDIGVGIDARGIVLDEEFRGYYPVMVTVGISRWMGSLKRDQLPER